MKLSPTKSLWSSSSFLSFPGGESTQSLMWGATMSCFTAQGSTHLTAVVNLPSGTNRSDLQHLIWWHAVLWTEPRIPDREVSEPLLSTRHWFLCVDLVIHFFLLLLPVFTPYFPFSFCTKKVWVLSWKVPLCSQSLGSAWGASASTVTCHVL